MIGIDSDLYQGILLKGFKGKGADLGRLLRQLNKAQKKMEEDKEHALFEMEQLVDQYDSVFKMPRKINLRIASTKGNKTLYWRLPGSSGNQPYIRIFQTDKGKEFLSSATPNFLAQLKNYELKRLLINYRYSCASKQLTSLSTLSENLAGFKATIAETELVIT